MFRISVTGHRPQKLGGYGADALAKVKILADTAVVAGFDENELPVSFVTGMALGWDQAIAAACIEQDVPFIAAVPFKGQELAWPEPSRKLYHELLAQAAEVVYVSEPGYTAQKMMIRNKWMVDNSNLLYACWDGSNGGTANCVRYARGVLTPVRNFYHRLADISLPTSEPETTDIFESVRAALDKGGLAAAAQALDKFANGG